MRTFALFVLVALVCGLAVAHSEGVLAPNDAAVAPTQPQDNEAKPTEITPANAENEEDMRSDDDAAKVENEEESDKPEQESDDAAKAEDDDSAKAEDDDAAKAEGEEEYVEDDSAKAEDDDAAKAEDAKAEEEDAKEDADEADEAKAEADEAFDFADEQQKAEQEQEDKTLETETESPVFAEIEAEDLLSNELYDEEADEEEEEEDEELADKVDDETGHTTAADDTDMRFRFAERQQQPDGAINPTQSTVPTVTDENAKNGVQLLKANSGDSAGDSTKGVTLLSKDGVGNSTTCACLGQKPCDCSGIQTQANNPEGIRIIKANVEPPKDPSKLVVIPKTSSTVVEP